MHQDPYHLARTNLGCPTLRMGWFFLWHTATLTATCHLLMVKINIHNHMEGHLITLLPPTNSHTLWFPLYHWEDPHWYPWCIWSLNQVRVYPQPPHITPIVVEVLQLPTCHMDRLHKTIHIFHFLVLPGWFLLHQDNHMLTLTLFIPLPFNRFIIFNIWIQKIHPINRIIPRIKEKIETITTSD